MAVDNKGGSDLDVFEGLGKKSTARTSQSPPAPPGAAGPSLNGPASRSSNGPPPPPPSLRQAPPQPPQPPGAGDNGGARNTLLGAAIAPPPVSQRSAPPPPPGRNALPAVSAPPGQTKSPSGTMPASSSQPTTQPRVPTSAPNTIPSGPTTKPGGAQAAAGKIDMDWDDDEEATHIFDKDNEGSKADAAPPPPPPPSRLPPPVSRPPQSQAKQTLLGVAAPPPPPPPPSMNPTPSPFRSSAVPPPPASVGSAFARASSVAASSPGPVPYPPPPPPSHNPPPPPHQAMTGAATMQPQQNTVPMVMPPRSVPPANLPPPPPAPSYRPPAQSQPSGLPALPSPSMGRMEATALVRPPEQNRTVYALLLVVGVLMVAFAIFFMMPHTGQVAVNVADSKGGAVSHLEIYIDGKKQCESAPCIVPDMSAGSHTVKVEAPGYEQAADKAVAVESRKDVTVDFNLVPLQSASTGLKVTGTQPGAKLFVDDREIGPLPQELKELQPGAHKIKIALNERYAPLEKTITVGQNELHDEGTLTLKVLKGKATISLGTPGAKVFIVSGSDRRELPVLPISVDIDTSKQWSLVASKPGFADYNQPISFDDGQAEKAFTVTLDPKAASTAVYTPPAYTPPSNPAPYTPPPPPVHHETHETPSANPPSESGGTGQAFLNINSIPASSVILDGKPIGSTPKLKYPVSAGSHSVLFVNVDQGFKKQISVSVGAGETKAAVGRN
jgi:hypothetical protein